MKFALITAVAAWPLGLAVSVSSEVARLAHAEELFLSKHPRHNRHAMANEKVRKEIDAELSHILNVGDADDLSKYVGKLEHLEASLGSFANKELLADVANLRMHICLDQGFQKNEINDCENFMGVACSLDGTDAGKITVEQDTCNRFFLKKHHAVLEAVRKSKKHKAKAGVKTAVQKNDTAAEGGNAAEGGEGLFGAKKERPLAEQGYNEYEDGRKVEHNNMETYTKDWQKEGKGRDIDTICKEFPNNEWCKLHTYEEPVYSPPPPPKSGALRCGSSFGMLSTVVVSALATAVLQ